MMMFNPMEEVLETFLGMGDIKLLQDGSIRPCYTHTMKPTSHVYAYTDLRVYHLNLLLGRLSRASRLLSRATIHVDWHHPGGRFLDMKEAGAAFQVEKPKPLTLIATPLPDSYPIPWIYECHSHKIQW